MNKPIIFIILLLIVSSCGRTDYPIEPIPSNDGTGLNNENNLNNSEPWCGNGKKEENEECDNGEANSDEPNAPCRTDCTWAKCGDGIQDTLTEECDDGSSNSDEPNAFCRTDCTLAKCGDGIQDTLTEECDKGGLNSQEPGAFCRTDCTLAKCGDGIQDPDEECDDGNNINDDACTNDCKKALCGDGIIQTSKGEVCDDGNMIDDISCSSDCSYGCGDGLLNAQHGEECDGTNLSDTQPGACRTDCRYFHCGDGVDDPNEFCLTIPKVLNTITHPVFIDFADINGDGFKDSIVGTEAGIEVFTQDPITRGYKRIWSIGGFPESYFITHGDIDNDGSIDFVSYSKTYKRLRVYKNTGNGESFNYIELFPNLRFSTSGVALLDYDLDGDLDIAIISNTAGQLEFINNDGSGNFSLTQPQDLCDGPVNLVSDDLNKDGAVDLVTVCKDQSVALIMYINPDGSFTREYLATESLPEFFDVKDLDKDGDKDLIVYSNNVLPKQPVVQVYYNSGNSFSQGLLLTQVELSSLGIYAVDLNRDYNVDFEVAYADKFTSFVKDGTSFTRIEHQNQPWGESNLFKLIDITNNFLPDRFIGKEVLYWFEDTLSPILPESWDLQGTIKLLMLDYNGDSNNDIIALTPAGLTLLYGDGSSGITSIQNIPFVDADFIGWEGDPISIFGTSNGTDIITILQSDGMGGYSVSAVSGPGVIPKTVLSNLQLDSDQAYEGAILYEEGFLAIIDDNSIANSIPVGVSPSMAIPVDSNTDGFTDFYVVDGLDVYLVQNDGLGSFNPQRIVQLTEIPTAIGSLGQNVVFAFNDSIKTFDPQGNELGTIELQDNIQFILPYEDFSLIVTTKGVVYKLTSPSFLDFSLARGMPITQLNDVIVGDWNNDGLLDVISSSDSKVFIIVSNP